MQDSWWQLATSRCGGAASQLISAFVRCPVPGPCCHHSPTTLACEYEVRWAEKWKHLNCSWKTVLLPTSCSSKPQDIFQCGYEHHLSRGCSRWILSLSKQEKICKGKKSDLETRRFVISYHAIWLSGKLSTLSIAKNQTTTLSSTTSWNIKTRVWYDTTRI